MPWTSHRWLSSQARRFDWSALVQYRGEGTDSERWILVGEKTGTVTVGASFDEARSRILAWVRAQTSPIGDRRPVP